MQEIVFTIDLANTVFEYNGRNGDESDDRVNAAKSVYGITASSILKKRYNYYENAKHTEKK